MSKDPSPPHPAWLQGLVVNATEVLGVIDAQGRLIWTNPAGERALGAQALGAELERTLAPSLVPATAAQLASSLARCLEGEAPSGPIRLPMPTDGARSLELSLAPLAPAAESSARGLVFGRDVTELERGRRAEAQVVGALERMGRGASVLAHDIKNPITALNLALRAVARHLGEDEQGVIEDLAVRMVRLERTLRRTVGFARPIELEPARVELAELAERTLVELAGEVAQAGALLELRVEPGLGLRADPERLAQALDALVRNALEAGAASPGAAPCVRIGARAEPGGIVLEVEDAGPGLSPAARANLFQPFHTTKEGASGLGLALAERCIEAHGGRIEVAQSELGGTRFSIHLPAQEEP